MCHLPDPVISLQVLSKENSRIDPVVLALADLIAEQPDRLLPHIHFEGDYCLACDWRRLDLKESAEVTFSIVLMQGMHRSHQSLMWYTIHTYFEAKDHLPCAAAGEEDEGVG